MNLRGILVREERELEDTRGERGICAIENF